MNNLVIELSEDLFSPASFKSYDGVWNPGTIENGPDTYHTLGDLSWNVLVTNTSDAFLVTGSVSGTLQSTCGRCLEDFTLSVRGEVEGYYTQDAQDAQAPDELGPDELLVLDDEKHINLEPLLLAAVLIELPLVALCDEACLGLCPQCGHNLNEGPCSCAQKEPEEDFSQNPFAVLKGIDFGNNEDLS